MKKFFLKVLLMIFIVPIKIANSFDNQSRLSAGGGIYNFMKHGDDAFNDSSKMYNVEYHFSKGKKQFIRPLIGFMGTSKSAYYAYFGLTTDLYFSKCKCILLTPSLAAGYYEDGDQIRLGHALEFRSGGELSYRFKNNVRIGVGAYHISNAGIGYRNPGSEHVVLRYHIPF
ncbi:MAG: acyloxyacyl hydrolase [Alphaproteobacteria bacterium]|nr:MAG: hypothetical protein CBB73_02570 [Pelagibacteraceae bacterium TMED13]